ncbi:hypothetical protein [Streptomyces violascens]|uniref:hypothetical protein n=1 Tax=Streptomyces violascens TaxID=67381 RepID=UPI001674EB4A|nr:hypothetical protein [Streptomyces violascens]
MRLGTPFFDSLSGATDVGYAIETHTDQQASPALRAEFLRTLKVLDVSIVHAVGSGVGKAAVAAIGVAAFGESPGRAQRLELDSSP